MAEPYWSSESENEEWKSDDGGEDAPSAEEQAATAEGVGRPRAMKSRRA